MFGFTRYVLNQRRSSISFIILFIGFVLFEAILARIVYRETGEISSFQIIVTIFVLYALTFGYNDFKKFDRWMRKKIGGNQLLTAKDYEEMEKQKDPSYQAKYYRLTWFAHLVVFFTVQVIFFKLSGLDFNESIRYISDPSWLNSEDYRDTPYSQQTFHTVSMIWGIIFVVDTIVASTYVFQRKDNC